MQPGYKSRINYSEAEYFNLSEKEVRIATAKRPVPVPTLEQIKHVIQSMPHQTDIQLRNRALVAFTLLTGARDSAIASMKLKHIDIASKSVFQDARDVKTKFSKTFATYFFPVDDEIEQIVHDWFCYLKENLLWGNDDPLFPKTQVAVGEERVFKAVGLEKAHWSNASPIRNIFREAFESAGLQYFNPHTFRKTLVNFGQQLCLTPEEFKAWSQNLGHDQMMTTFYSYGEVQEHRQGEILQKLKKPRIAEVSNQTTEDIIRAVVRAMTEQQTHQNG